MFDRQPWMQRAGDYPRTDEGYFALLARAVFSAGLGPKVVESRWPGLVAAFRGFDPVAVSEMGEEDVATLLTDTSVIRNRRKIEAVVANAFIFRDVLEEHGSFRHYLDSIGSGEDFEGATQVLAERFRHLGSASAGFFLYSCGWRRKEASQSAA
ncbi:MAG: hypothetical protein GX604_06855 [Actinobacteria bacterium]|nr:hypothetical protein [Actinomycetota bacterium]